MKGILIVGLICLCFTASAYAQLDENLYSESWLKDQSVKFIPSFKKDLLSSTQVVNEPNEHFFFRWFNKKAIAADSSEDRAMIRKQWKETLGVDVFYPYFKAKEIQDNVQEKTKVELFSIKGRAELDEKNNQVKYIFKKRF